MMEIFSWKKKIICIQYFCSRSVLALAVNQMSELGNITSVPSNCNNSIQLWETGKKLYE